jgi:hypothetical protein
MNGYDANGRPIYMGADGCEVFTLSQIIELEIDHIVDMTEPIDITKPQLNG